MSENNGGDTNMAQSSNGSGPWGSGGGGNGGAVVLRRSDYALLWSLATPARSAGTPRDFDAAWTRATTAAASSENA